jgi:hypothetical protein
VSFHLSRRYLMLVMFLTSDPDRKCRVVKYCDRIWIDSVNPEDPVIVFRSLIIEVDEESEPVRDIFMLVPRGIADNRIEDVTHRWGKPEYVHNIYYTAGPLVLGDPTGSGSSRRWTLEQVDGIPKVHFFEHNEMSVQTSNAEFSYVRIGFPEAVQPGERVALGMQFGAQGILKLKYPTALDPGFTFMLSYFSPLQRETYANSLGALLLPCEIPVCMIYSNPSPGVFGGGFDIFLVFAEGCRPLRVSPDAEELDEEAGLDGLPLKVLRNKLAWRMRRLCADQFRAGVTSISTQSTPLGVSLQGEFFRPGYEYTNLRNTLDDTQQAILYLSEQVDGTVKAVTSLSGQVDDTVRAVTSLSKEVEKFGDAVAELVRTQTTVTKLLQILVRDNRGIILSLVTIAMAVVAMAVCLYMLFTLVRGSLG